MSKRLVSSVAMLVGLSCTASAWAEEDVVSQYLDHRVQYPAAQTTVTQRRPEMPEAMRKELKKRSAFKSFFERVIKL